MESPSYASSRGIIAREAAIIAWRRYQCQIPTTWVHVPLGIVLFLGCSFGVDLIITSYLPFSFPAPVALMAILFLLLLLLDYLSVAFPGSEERHLPVIHVDSVDTLRSQQQPRTKLIYKLALTATRISTTLTRTNRITEAKMEGTKADEKERETPSPAAEIAKAPAPERRRFLDPVMRVIEKPCMFCLRHMSVMFTPSFIRIPAREEILPGKEIGLIIAWFVATQIIAFIVPIVLYRTLELLRRTLSSLCRVLLICIGRRPTVDNDEAESLPGDVTQINSVDNVDLEKGDDPRRKDSTGLQRPTQPVDGIPFVLHSSSPCSPKSSKSVFSQEERRVRSESTLCSPPIMSSSLGSSPSGIVAGVDASGSGTLTLGHQPSIHTSSAGRKGTTSALAMSDGKERSREDIREELYAEKTIHDVSRGDHMSTSVSPQFNETVLPESGVAQDRKRDVRIIKLAGQLEACISPLVYFIVFLVSIPIFYVTKIHYSLPLFLSLNIFVYILAVTAVPPKIKKAAHPILTTSIVMVFMLWALGEIKGLGLKQTLRLYSSGTKYLDLWRPSFSGPGPGAGDVLMSTLDAGIVALAVPMYNYRRDLKRHFFTMMSIIVPCCALSLFAWPTLAYLIGIESTRALTFSARFMSTPLAIELVEALRGDESICVILVVVTGIVAAILKDWWFYKVLRLKRDDFLCVGLTMGTTSGAIGASSLLQEPRTMAIASLSFVLFGAVLLAAGAVPAVVDIVRGLVRA